MVHSEKIRSTCVMLEQQRGEWGLSQQQIDSAVEMIVLDCESFRVHHDVLRLFLYAKGILFDEGKATRLEKYNNLLDPDSSGLPALVVEKLRKGRAGLLSIVEEGEKSSDFEIGSKTMFDCFVETHPEWSPGRSFVVFRDHRLLVGKPRSLVERVQKSGLCYMHAPVVLQHYVVAMQRDDNVPMLDMGLYLRQSVSSEALRRHIWDYRGGDSRVFLEHILHEPLLLSHGPTADLRGAMRDYGPGLLQGFKVEDAFMSKNWQHLGVHLTGDFIGCHAMVLVGYRKEGDTNRFLLQNWWKSKPFVEVDADYLESCGAVVHFVKTPQPRMGSFPANMHDHVECELLDVPENIVPEMNL